MDTLITAVKNLDHKTILELAAKHPDIFGFAELIIFAIVAGLLTLILGRRSEAKGALFWYLWDAMVHICMEGFFVYFQLFHGDVNSVPRTATFPNLLVGPWQEYAKADIRWGIFDPTTVSIELITSTFVALLCLILAIAAITNASWRHPLNIILCSCELYGGWMTFAPEWVSGNKNLVTNNPIYLYGYLWGSNGLWVVIPAILLVDSLAACTSALRVKKTSAPSPSKKKH